MGFPTVDSQESLVPNPQKVSKKETEALANKSLLAEEDANYINYLLEPLLAEFHSADSFKRG